MLINENRIAFIRRDTQEPPQKHLYLSAGWNDIISDKDNRSIYGGFSIRFEDDDLKYLLTTTPIPK